MIDLDQIVEDFSERQEIKTVCQITIFFQKRLFFHLFRLKLNIDQIENGDFKKILNKISIGICRFFLILNFLDQDFCRL